MTHQEMWDAFSRETGTEAPYEAWAFGDDPDTLAELVRRGVKTATSSLRCWYRLEELPKEGQYSVILDALDRAVCVIRTTKVYTVRFDRVSSDHARKESEGDRSLGYWRSIHEAFFRKELGETVFDPSMDVVCEEFETVFGSMP